MTEHPPMIGLDWGTEKIDLRHLENPIIARPTEIHHKADGGKSDDPSFTIIMRADAAGFPPREIYGEVTLRMLNEALGEIGYEIRRV